MKIGNKIEIDFFELAIIAIAIITIVYYICQTF